MKKLTQFTVAITGMNSLPENPAAGISVATCLREAFGERVRIVGLGYDAFDAGLYLSDYCDAAYLIPYPRFGTEPLVLRLHEIQMMEKINVLIPCLDVELMGIIGIEDKLLSLGIHTFLPRVNQLTRCYKDRLHELAYIVNVNYPETRPLYSAQFFNTCTIEGWTFPMVIKGPFCDAKTVYTVEAGIFAYYEIAKDWGVPILAQRYIPGEEYNLTAIGDGLGNMIGEVIMKKVALTSKNKACVGVTTYDEALVNIARKIVKELQWRGPFELEVMLDANGVYHMIEINPRFPAWIALSQKVGRNLPALLLEMILGLKTSPLNEPAVGSYFIRYAHEQLISLNQVECMITYGSSVVTTKG